MLCGYYSGLWGEACKASVIVKENCALQCISAPCYESIYGADPVSLDIFYYHCKSERL